MLPNLFVPAFPKSATTSLVYTLHQHPDIAFPKGLKEVAPWHCYGKEPRWFFTGKEPDLLSRIDEFSHFYGGARVRVDGTPDYFMFPEVLDLMQKHCPEAKLIVMMREPIERLLSRWNHYLEMFSRGEPHLAKAWRLDDSMTFEENLRVELDDSEAHRELVWPSRYIEHIENIQSRWPSENIHFAFFEDWKRNPVYECMEIQKFLDVEVRALPIETVNVIPRKEEVRLSAELRKELESYFQPTIEGVRDLMGRVPPEWKYH